ncbi:hypothetical protein CFC21_048417 [Triticum aestivum]|uniref:BZIP domain-containing protein n=3 Tax=Triticinae TaxID=1648030 RepID=A0A9R1K294_WHEAT|nr:basic leucine zipper 23 [Aegilops tauschii subsp. strangulata]XP_044353552.1 basic leucine zipper 23-like [Triticum aestivum]KAF7038211.1 hypothetical protein CFC21_048416 [Triticum aestivum]KAF7038212.1 hypothetical protein CFC21_048417 [Triticum aestivum]
MDDGLYLPIPSHLLFPYPEISHGFDDEFLACTHTHTCCNVPSWPAAAHAHTCLHAHTQVIASGEDHAEHDQLRNLRKPLGNREAVRKYRQKKKAHAAFLEEEVKKLRAANQQLLRRLQGHAALEAEVARLTGLLLDVRGKIDAAEIGALPLEERCSFGSVVCTAAEPTPCFDAGGAEVAAVREAGDVDDGGIVSGELGVPEVVDAVASFVNSAA